MAVDLIDRLSRRIRTREAIRDIRQIPVDDRIKKMLLAEWFQEHRRAAASPGQKKAAYDQLLGRSGNRRQRG